MKAVSTKIGGVALLFLLVGVATVRANESSNSHISTTASWGSPPTLSTQQCRGRILDTRGEVLAYSTPPKLVRCHPHGMLAAHVLGYVDHDGNGADGIERQFEKHLKAGMDVQLALDSKVQAVVEEELTKAMQACRPTSVVGIVMRPRTGEILAMVVAPGFDPGAPSKTLAASDSSDKGMGLLRNRCVTDVAEPGGVFAVVPVAGALNEKLLTLEQPLDCTSPFMFERIPLRDGDHHGKLTLKEVVAKGSSIGFAKVGTALGQQHLHDYVHSFGFGERTGVDLPGEVLGILHPLAKWTKLSITRIPIGHEVAVTPLQMCVAMNVFATQGVLKKPLIVRALLNREGKPVEQFSPVKVRQVISPETASQMVEALIAVTEPGGSGAKAAVNGYDVAGKTGTAQKIQEGQYVAKYYATFAGFVPARNPELCILIAVDNPNDSSGAHLSGDVAAPVFRAVAERILKHLNNSPARAGDTSAGQTEKTSQKKTREPGFSFDASIMSSICLGNHKLP